jgi:hypothetical protein
MVALRPSYLEERHLRRVVAAIRAPQRRSESRIDSVATPSMARIMVPRGKSRRGAILSHHHLAGGPADREGKHDAPPKSASRTAGRLVQDVGVAMPALDARGQAGEREERFTQRCG